VGTVARETVRTYLRAIRVFARWLTRPPYRLLATDPLADLTLPRASRRFKQPLNADEIDALLDAVDAGTIVGARDRAMLLVLLDGGLRATELANLRYGDLNIRDQSIFVAAGKGDASRYVTLGQTTIADIRAYLLVHEALLCGAAVTVNGKYLRPKPTDLEDAPLFPTVQGEYFGYDGLKSWFGRIAERAGVPRAHLHLMRHTSAAQSLDAGADIRVVQLRLGHKDITTTQRYLYLARERLARLESQYSPVDHLGIGKPDGERRSKRTRSTQPTKPMWRRRAERTTPGKRTPQQPKKQEKQENHSQPGDAEEPGAPAAPGGVRK
jgi:integrase/recombinase XerD